MIIDNREKTIAGNLSKESIAVFKNMSSNKVKDSSKSCQKLSGRTNEKTTIILKISGIAKEMLELFENFSSTYLAWICLRCRCTHTCPSW